MAALLLWLMLPSIMHLGSRPIEKTVVLQRDIELLQGDRPVGVLLKNTRLSYNGSPDGTEQHYSLYVFWEYRKNKVDNIFQKTDVPDMPVLIKPKDAP
ncbi:MAG: hypothetical protein P8Y36_09275 [Alphaproteobacteria bacterium]